MVKTVRFYRDLLGMKLTAGIGHDGYRHYFFRLGDAASHIAFFEYEGASPMKRKFPGERTSEPVGFDHVSLTVDSRLELFALKDRLEAAGFDVHGAVDHGTIWSIYFYDPNGIPLEATWEILEIVEFPAIEDDDPLDIAAEGADLQPGHWPEVKTHTAPEDMVAKSGNGLPMRESFLKRGLARYRDEADRIAAE
ncbi:MAG: VOC family protein [Rhodospirillales bacterium]|nr:VOC family protein [Rhodospirillales bacterium]